MFKAGDFVRRKSDKLTGAFIGTVMKLNINGCGIFRVVDVFEGAISLQSDSGEYIGPWSASNFVKVERKSHLPEWF